MQISTFLSKFIILITFVAGTRASAQLLTTPVSPTQAVGVLVGAGLTSSNIVFMGDTTQLASYTATGTTLPIASGLVISTGIATNPLMNGPYTNFCSDPAPNGIINYPLLNQISGVNTNDGAILQFDFIPTGDTLKFQYVFGSEEYNDFVNGGVNDAFGFFLTGPDPVGGTYTDFNVALIPGTPIPVSINTVNNGVAGLNQCAFGPCNNCAYFIDNACPGVTNIAPDAYTVVLTAIAPVVACSTYTIKLAIGDGGDDAYDSWVFLAANSFVSNQVTLSSNVSLDGNQDLLNNDTLLFEGCTDATIHFVRSGDTTMTDSISFTLSGTATPNVDYTTNAINYLIFPPGEDTLAITITPLMDAIIDDFETITITIIDTVCNNPNITTLTIIIRDVQMIQNVNAGIDDSICEGASIFLGSSVTGGSGLFEIFWNNPDSIPDSISYLPTVSGYFDVSVYDRCLDTTAYDSIYVTVYPRPDMNLPDIEACSGVGTPIGFNGFPGYNFTWNPGTYLSSNTVSNPTFTHTNPGPGDANYIYIVRLDSGELACPTDTINVLLHPLPDFELNPDTTSFCEGESVMIDAGGAFNSYQWSTGETTSSITANSQGWYTAVVTDANNCENSDSIFVDQQLLPVFEIPDVAICEGDSIFLYVSDTIGTSFLWSTSSIDTGIVVSTAGEFWLTVTNDCGSSSDSVTVSLQANVGDFPLPNVFTPNGDGVNDEYEVSQMLIADSFRMDIFNRWGRLIYTTTDVNNWWKGEGDGGSEATEGTYFVVLNYINCNGDEFTKNGVVNIFK